MSALTMLFVARCGNNIDSLRFPGDGVIDTTVNQKGFYESLLNRQQNEHDAEVRDLKEKISKLQMQVSSLQEEIQQLKIDKTEVGDKTNIKKYFNKQIESCELKRGISYHNEYELTPFNSFTSTRIFMVDPGLGKRVVERPIGYKKKDLTEVVFHAVDSLNARRRNKKNLFTIDDLYHGIYRTDQSIGSHYELYFEDIDNTTAKMYSKITVARPFGPLHTIKQEDLNTKELINLIIPLSGRQESFQIFMKYFIKVCILEDKHVYLTVVYFGSEGLLDIKNELKAVESEYNFVNYKVIPLNEKFSRGRGLQVGVQSWSDGDALQFLCDVDMIFKKPFLERCRMNSIRGKRVYYPMVFSLYNPHVVYALHDSPIPSLDKRLGVSRDTGFWRDFGYGMTCQYKSDFVKIGGFDESIEGWGGEDVQLYRKYIKSQYFVVRATDPAIFHIWHEKHCDPELAAEQYTSCIRSKALNEASHSQLGLLAFKDEVDLHRTYRKKHH